MNFNRRAASIPLIGCLATFLSGCGGEPLPPADLGDDGGIASIGHVSGHMQNGTLALGSLSTSDSGVGVTPQGFGTFGSGTVSFNTQPGDGVNTGSCTATEYCGTVDTTNDTGRLMDNLFVEITGYNGVTPAGAAVAWAGAPTTATAPYLSVFANATPETASYGNFAIGQTKSLEWKFNLNAGSTPATDFYFDAEVYASFRRTSPSGAVQTKQSGINACAVAGATTYLTASDDAEANFLLPFPYTLYDLTYDRAVVGSNGYLLFYKTGSSAPSSLGNNTNLGPAVVPGYYVFWDDLAYDAGDGVCVAVAGTKPNRSFIVTWKNAKISTSQPAKGTWSTEKVRYSLILTENTDRYIFVYDLPSGGITDFTRGIGATTGVRATRNGGNIAYQYTLNRLSPYIPAAAASYGGRIVGTMFEINP